VLSVRIHLRRMRRRGLGVGLALSGQKLGLMCRRSLRLSRLSGLRLLMSGVARGDRRSAALGVRVRMSGMLRRSLGRGQPLSRHKLGLVRGGRLGLRGLCGLSLLTPLLLSR
jgi:hypothetical protein